MLLRVLDSRDSVRRRKDTILRTAKVLQGDEYGRSGRPSTRDVPTPTLAAGQRLLYSCSSCQLSLCLLLFAITQGICHVIHGLEGLRGSRLYRNDEMQTCNCTKPINARGCQGMNRTSLHTANQCTAQLNYVFLFSFSLWSYFLFHEITTRPMIGS